MGHLILFCEIYTYVKGLHPTPQKGVFILLLNQIRYQISSRFLLVWIEIESLYGFIGRKKIYSTVYKAKTIRTFEDTISKNIRTYTSTYTFVSKLTNNYQQLSFLQDFTVPYRTGSDLVHIISKCTYLLVLLSLSRESNNHIMSNHG